MREVGVLEAKTHLSKLIEEIETTGEEIVITRHGKPVVRLTRIGAARPPLKASELVERLRKLRESQLPDPEMDSLTWEELKEQIRR